MQRDTRGLLYQTCAASKQWKWLSLWAKNEGQEVTKKKYSKGKLKCSKVFRGVGDRKRVKAISPIFLLANLRDSPPPASPLITHDVFGATSLAPKPLSFFCSALSPVFPCTFNYAQALVTSEWAKINLAKSWGINRTGPKRSRTSPSPRTCAWRKGKGCQSPNNRIE